MANNFYTDDMIDFLREKSPEVSRSLLTLQFNKKFRTKKSVEEISQACNVRYFCRRVFYTKEMITFLKNNVEIFDMVELSEQFNAKFGTNKTSAAIKQICRQKKIGKARTKFKYTQEMINFLEENYQRFSRKQLASLFNSKFKTNRLVSGINAVLVRSGIDIEYTRFQYTQEMRTFIEENHSEISRKHLTSIFNSKFETDKSVRAIDAAKADMGIAREIKKPLGAETICNGYVFVKTAHPNVWTSKQALIWKENYGEIPRGFSIMFADGNRKNFNLDNLIMVSKQELCYVNFRGLRFDDPEATKVGVSIAKVIIKTRERLKEIDSKSQKGKI